MRNIKVKPVAPLYTFTTAWVLYSFAFPLYKLSHFIICLCAATFFFLISKCIFKTKIVQVEDKKPEPVPIKEAPPKYSPEVDAILKEGELARLEMERLSGSIKNAGVQEKIAELIRVSSKIIDFAIHDQAAVPQIKKFLSFFLPTTIKLLNAYDRMDAQGVEGENISGSMSSIESMLDTAITAYKKQLNSLFANQALDIESDISVMNAMLQREGLTGKTF